jgi:hypothetical protein
VGAVVNIMSGLDASRERFQAKMEALKARAAIFFVFASFLY